MRISIVFIFLGLFTYAQQTYIQCGKIFDSKKGVLMSESTIIVENEKIIDIKKGFLTSEIPTDKIIDLKSKYVLPGLIDMHVHLEGETDPKRYLKKYTENEADRAYSSVKYAERTLLAGFTTVRDLGGTGVNVSLRNAINSGDVIGPRIYTSEKSLGTTGGHADPTNGSSRKLMGNPGPKEGVVNSVDDAKKAVRQRYKNGADCIKITATGGVLSVAKSGQNPQFTFEEIKAVVETANDYGMHVAAHAHGDEGMYRAVLAGVKTIEHGTLMSERTMDLMKKKNSFLVPTITAGKQVEEKAKIPGYYPDIIVPKALAIGPKIQSTFGKAYKRGVPISFGTDAGVFPHGLNAKEFIYMVEAGMPEKECIQSATITNAKILQKEDLLGQIASGYYADIIATDNNPLDDISALQNIVFVMKNGQVYKSVQ
ncbi:MAG: amidohydrolase [Flavobacteriaceae bacterium]|nr:amidohydrolase [Flavobacteriaceae bacterium]